MVPRAITGLQHKQTNKQTPKAFTICCWNKVCMMHRNVSTNFTGISPRTPVRWLITKKDCYIIVFNVIHNWALYGRYVSFLQGKVRQACFELHFCMWLKCMLLYASIIGQNIKSIIGIISTNFLKAFTVYIYLRNLRNGIKHNWGGCAWSNLLPYRTSLFKFYWWSI